ncbi:MAG: 50S ribosomal protein L4 [Candidatus Thermoplasmatota archaeon]|nr:50S ribosomal protein L4 [Candidatus Thermoplasmatota archaeon]
MKLKIYSLKGKAKKRIELPAVLEEPYRPDIIKRAVCAIQANRRQPYGASIYAGKRHVAVWIGKGRGMSRVPRLANGTGSFAPGTVGGRRAHPPKAEKRWREKINKKEKKKALRSALSATKDKELVIARGHKFNPKLTLPIVIEDEFENLATVKEVIEVFKKLGVYEDLERAKNNTHIRAGIGKRRGRKYHVPKSILVIVSKLEKIGKGVRNLPGIDIATARTLNTELLAPGGVAGRLTALTEKALQEVTAKFG